VSQLKELLAQRASHEKMRSKSAASRCVSSDSTRAVDRLSKDTTALDSAEKLELVIPAAVSKSVSPAAPPATSPASKHKLDDHHQQQQVLPKNCEEAVLPPAKRTKKSNADVTARNFLGIGAMKAKEARFARSAARVGFQRSKKNKSSHTGSGVPLSQVIRLKYVKGFTEAVRTPCRLDDLA